MGVILILGRTEDLCCQGVLERLARDGRETLFLPEDKLLPQMEFAWTPADGAGRICFEGRDVSFSEIDGVLYRFYGIPLPAEDFGTADGRYVCSEWNALWMAWLNSPGRTSACPVINRLRPDLWYKTSLNAPALAALVPDLPFARPRTLVTTSPDAARSFRRRVSGTVTYTALSGSSPYPIQGEEEFEKLLALNGALPLHLTEEVAGRRCEAFVVGGRVTLVGPDGAVCGTPPSGLADRCVRVGTRLGLAFFRLSLAVGAGDEWHCLGLDRVPQLYACGPEAQAEIVERLAALLTGPDGQERGCA